MRRIAAGTATHAVVWAEREVTGLELTFASGKGRHSNAALGQTEQLAAVDVTESSEYRRAVTSAVLYSMNTRI